MKFGMTPLHEAVRHGFLKRHEIGMTPLHEAVIHGYFDICTWYTGRQVIPYHLFSEKYFHYLQPPSLKI